MYFGNLRLKKIQDMHTEIHFETENFQHYSKTYSTYVPFGTPNSKTKLLFRKLEI